MYECFETLLEELGFQIEFVPDEERIREVTKDIDTQKHDFGANAQIKDNDPQRRSRRASLSSLYDAEDESTRAIGSRRASMSRVDYSQRSVLEVRPSTRATTRKTEKTVSNPSPFESAALQARRGRLTAAEFANTLQHPQSRRKSVSSPGNERGHQPTAPASLRRNDPILAAPHSRDVLQATSDVEDQSTEISIDHGDIQPAYAIAQHDRFYNPSRTQLLRDAETFHHYRIRSVARDIVDKWCYAALHDRDQHEHMERLAASHDTEILLRQAFEHWRVRLHARKQAAQTERYFKLQERRIARARDLMLLAKAFSHWEQCLRDERTWATKARQHVLSIKYFQAWKDVTLTNQRNVRLRGLRKFFGMWKQRYIQILTDNIKADLVLHELRARNAYWHWFWAFCERRSPQWRDGRLRRKYLCSWVNAFQRNRRTEQHVVLRSEDLARRKTFSQWLQKCRVVFHGRQRATAFNEQKEAAHALQSLRAHRLYAPSIRQVSNMVDWRVAGATFTTFISRYRFEKQAEAVDRLRMLRNAWTRWNDFLRWQTVAHRINDRYCLEALYKWVVAERFILLQRLSEERLKQRILCKLSEECKSRQLHRDRTCQVIEKSRRKDCLQSFLIHWHSHFESCRHAGRMAFEFHAPKLTQDALQSWNQSLAHVQKLHGWANDAHFYFATRRFLKRWQSACIESKRQKRKNAYIQVRRKSKIKLAGGTMQRWRSITSQLHDMQSNAGVVYQDHLLQFGTGLFDQWKDQSDLRMDQNTQANQHYSRRLLERHLYTWIERLEEQSRLEELADLNYDMRIKNMAFSWFNKLRLKIIELKGQESNAENLRIWYEKRHFRNILRQWQDQTTKRLNPPEAKTFSSRVNRSRPRTLPDEGPTSRVEDWTDFDIGDWIPGLEAQTSTTPLPGYLSTPSKRAARAKALVRVSTTPAGTPFEQRLRSQIGSTPRTARRGGFGRSMAALRGSTFGAILEDSPRTPNREG